MCSSDLLNFRLAVAGFVSLNSDVEAEQAEGPGLAHSLNLRLGVVFARSMSWIYFFR